jgi:CDP-glycerol glycerophosphotransferase
VIDISKKDIDVQEILIHTDVLITDYSSVFFDFMSTKKPVIFYTYDYQDYLSKCRGMYYDFKQELQGPFADDEESLIDYIKSYEKWSINPDYIKKYNLVLDKFNSFQDANSSKRLIDFLYPI